LQMLELGHTILSTLLGFDALLTQRGDNLE